jgi:hypothetical protein
MNGPRKVGGVLPVWSTAAQCFSMHPKSQMNAAGMAKEIQAHNAPLPTPKSDQAVRLVGSVLAGEV